MIIWDVKAGAFQKKLKKPRLHMDYLTMTFYTKNQFCYSILRNFVSPYEKS